MRYNPYFEMGSALFLVVVAVHFFARCKFRSRLNTFFGAFIIVGLVDLCADVASVYVIESAASNPMWINWGVNLLLYVCQTALGPMLYMYVLCLSGYVDEKKYRAVIGVSMLPAAVTTALVLADPWTGMFFYFGDGAVYKHGDWFLALYIGTAFYLLLSASIILMRRSYMRRVEFNTMLTFIAATMLSVALQAVFPTYLVTGVALALAIVMMYLTMQNPDDMLDSLTGAFNRNAFFLYIDSRLKRRERFQLTVFDIKGISAVNRLFGIALGDRALAGIGDYLRRADPRGRLFRIIGDSFVLLSPGGSDADSIAERASERFRGTWSIGEVPLHVRADICRISSACECASADELVELIDRGLSECSERDAGAPVIITREMHDSLKRMNAAERLLREALGGGDGLELYLQPIYDLEKNRVSGAEALARLRGEDGRLLPPADFIPAAERTGLILQLGKRMIDESCRFLRRSGLADDPDFEGISVNLSVVECVSEGLCDTICSSARGCNIDPRKLCFEITETTTTISEALPVFMRSMRESGFHFALDDFGTGYANYDSIMRLPFSAAKFDKSMLDMARLSPANESVFFSSIDIARVMGYGVVVEGVETREQALLLAEHGLRYLQGFYFACPMPCAEFPEAYRSLRGVV